MSRVISFSITALVLAAIGSLHITSAHAQFQRCPLITQISLEECRTLEKLFFDTDGPNWINIRGWLRSNQPCEWYGVTCLSEGWPRRITKIDLSGNDLSGSLPGELSRLTQLRELRIDNSGPGHRFRKLTGNLPAVLGQLEHLEVLLLGNNDFTGSIPMEYGNLASLQQLSLANNKLTGPVPESFAELGNVRRMDLSGNQLAGTIPDVFAALTSLEDLDLSSNLFTGPVPTALGRLTKLRSLNLSGNALTGALPDTLANLSRLIWLSLADNDLAGALPLHTARFAAGINSCSLSGNQLCIPDNPVYADLDPVCGLPKDGTCRVCAGTDCDALEAVFVATGGTAWMTRSDWLATRDLCRWHGVSCTGDRVTGLYLANNAVSGRLPGALGELVLLEELNLSGNVLSGPVPDSLSTLTALSVVNMSDNQLSGPVPLAVASLGSRAQVCDFSGNPGLCMPDQPDYRAFGPNICGISLNTLCGEFPLVQVSGLRVEPQEQAARLYWQTDAPAIGLRFDVEIITGQDVSVAGSVHGKAPTTYSYTVENLHSGPHTFQIRQISPTGASVVTDPLTVRLYEPGLTITGPYPNPFFTRTQLSLVAGSELPVQVDVFDVTGRRIQTLYRGQPALHVPWSLQFGPAALPGGTYFIRVLSQNATLQTFQVQHVR